MVLCVLLNQRETSDWLCECVEMCPFCQKHISQNIAYTTKKTNTVKRPADQLMLRDIKRLSIHDITSLHTEIPSSKQNP